MQAVPTASAVGSATAPRDTSMSLFQRLNAEKGLQLPVFGTPVLGERLAALLQHCALDGTSCWRCFLA